MDPVWAGGLGSATGGFMLLCHARLAPTAGTCSTPLDETWTLCPVPRMGKMNPAEPVADGDPVGHRWWAPFRVLHPRGLIRQAMESDRRVASMPGFYE